MTRFFVSDNKPFMDFNQQKKATIVSQQGRLD
jgi:hypothetical protein